MHPKPGFASVDEILCCLNDHLEPQWTSNAQRLGSKMDKTSNLVALFLWHGRLTTCRFVTGQALHFGPFTAVVGPSSSS
eukprot:3382377-Amphidinium_carterae.1